MAFNFPFLTSYDALGSSEGALDPLGLYQIADTLAIELVPAVRERMQRIRFLTAMAVGALVTDGLDDDPGERDSSPYLVWEWLVIEAFIRQMADDASLWGIPGTQLTRRALSQHGYLDARSYLKTPRIFGFNGVYKRLAIHLGIVDVNLGIGPNAEALADAWARGHGFLGLSHARSLLAKWSEGVRRCFGDKPPRTKPGWSSAEWAELASAFGPSGAKLHERRHLHDMLHSDGDRRLGALPAIWQLQNEFHDSDFREERLHDLLGQREPDYTTLLAAIRAYETFARALQDAFDILLAEAARGEVQGFGLSQIAADAEFNSCIRGLQARFEAAQRALGEVHVVQVSLKNRFEERFSAFAAPMDPTSCARELCTHHVGIQRGKSPEGKRAWFDRIGPDRIYVRHAYRRARQKIRPNEYVHDYRGRPIRRFRSDLS